MIIISVSKKKKTIKCILCGKNESEDIADHSCFFTIIPEDLNEKKLFNIFKNIRKNIIIILVAKIII